MRSCALSLVSLLLMADAALAQGNDWQIGPFIRLDDANPIILPDKNSLFFCPVQKREVRWECDHTFNPGAVVREGKVYIFYRAEDDFGQGIGCHTSRLGIAESHDGIHFTRDPAPVLYPNEDSQQNFEWPGGCEDPRIVQREDGIYVMTYTQWTLFNHANRNVPLLGIALSQDLRHWEKRGYAFAHSQIGPHYSKSGSIVCKRAGDCLIAVKIKGKYWMYWGEGTIYGATSEDLIAWDPIVDKEGDLLPVLEKRPGKFDSLLVEAGPPALLTDSGILLLYNGKNGAEDGDPRIGIEAYSAGQALFGVDDPTHAIERSEESFFKPEKEYEKTGQYKNGTVFIEGLVPFQGRWLLYYGTADSAVGVAVSEMR